MAAELSQDAVLAFLRSSGGSVRNADLLLHFRPFLRDHAERIPNRELFKKFVNSVATVQQLDGVSYVVLRRKFKRRSPDEGGASPGSTVLPAAGIIPVNNSNKNTKSSVDESNLSLNLNLKQRHSSTSSSGAAAQRESPALKNPQPPALHSRLELGAPGGFTPPIGAPGDFTPPVRPQVAVHQVGAPGDFTPPVRPQVAVHQVGAPGGFSPPIGAPGGVTPPVRAPGVHQVGTPGGFTPPVRAPASFTPPVRPQVAVHQVQQSRVELGAPGGFTPPVRAPEGVHQQASVLPLHQEPPQPQAVAPVCRFRYRPSYRSAMSCDEDEEEEEVVPVRQGSAGGVWPPSGPLGDMRTAMSASTPCITAPPSVASSSSSSERPLPKIYIQDVQGGQVPPGGHSWGAGPHGPSADEWASSRCSLPAEVLPHMPSPGQTEDVAPGREGLSSHRGGQSEPGLEPSHIARLSSSHSSVFSASSDAAVSSSDWPPSGSPRPPRSPKWSSTEDLQPTAGRTGRGLQIQGAPQHSQRTSSESLTNLSTHRKTSVPWSHSTDHLLDDQDLKAQLMPRHLSTGNLLDDSEGVDWREGSTSAPLLRPRVVGQLSNQSRSRMCRSMGADLDQLLREEARLGGGGSEAARLNRLHLLSSSLSLGNNLSSSSLSSCSTPPLCNSMDDLLEGANRPEGRTTRRSHPAAPTHQHQGVSSRQSLVPLDPREHDWLVKAAAGAWPDIYSLFREDSSLLNRRDFISGFTVLHWIAKHGDHRVLNTLWYGVEKAGLSFDVNARSMCGQTPLHIAAIHGHKNILRLLVCKFSADVRLRDTAGKKAWQYLSSSTAADIFQLLGRGAGQGRLGGQRPEASRKQEEQQRRRRRHHFSSASSGQRPHSTARVKRSTSLAAFLKHKSLRHIHQSQQSDSPSEQ